MFKSVTSLEDWETRSLTSYLDYCFEITKLPMAYLVPIITHMVMIQQSNWQRAHAVWCLSSKNKLECVVTEIKSYQHFNCLTFPFLAGTKLHVHGVNVECSSNLFAIINVICIYFFRWAFSSSYLSFNTIFGPLVLLAITLLQHYSPTEIKL